MLRTFIDNVPDLIYVKDLESRFVVANLAVAAMVGAQKPEDLLGKPTLTSIRANPPWASMKMSSA